MVTTATQFLGTLEQYARQLSSVKERLDALKKREEAIREKVNVALKTIKKDKVETVYGTFTIRASKIPDFSNTPVSKDIAKAEKKVKDLELKLKSAQVALDFMKNQAIKEFGNSVTYTEGTKVLAFNRNKSVSARAKKNRIYVRTFYNVKGGVKTVVEPAK